MCFIIPLGTGDLIHDSADTALVGTIINAVEGNFIRGAIDAGFALSVQYLTPFSSTVPDSDVFQLNQLSSQQQYVSFPVSATLLSSSFTLSFWALPSTTQTLPSQSVTTSVTPAGEQPTFTSASSSADIGSNFGCSIAVASNGIVVYISNNDMTFAPLVWQGPISTWVYVTVTFTNNLPALYINGVLQQTGLQVSSTVVFVPLYIGYSGSSPASYYNGAVDNFFGWNAGFNASLVQTLYTQKLSQGLAH